MNRYVTTRRGIEREAPGVQRERLRAYYAQIVATSSSAPRVERAERALARLTRPPATPKPRGRGRPLVDVACDQVFKEVFGYRPGLPSEGE